MIPGIIVTACIAVVCLLGLVLVRIGRNKLLKPNYQAIMVTLWTITCMTAIVMASLLIGLNRLWLILYGLMMLTLVGLYLYSLYKATRGLGLAKTPAWLRHFWNIQKSFGGGAFGDFANTVGVLAGVGAYQLINANEGWFWLGQFGALLAALVGLSLVVRYLNLDRLNPFMPWYAVLNFAVGSFTLLAIASPIASPISSPISSTTRDMVALVRTYEMKVTQTVILVLMLINIAFLWYKIEAPKEKRKLSKSLPWVFMLVLGSGVIAALWAFQAWLAPDWLTPIFSSLAVGSWMTLEFLSAIQNRREVVKVLRSLSAIVGNLFMFGLVVSVAIENPGEFSPAHWFLYSAAIIFTVLATLAGIILAARTVAVRHEDRQNRRQRSYTV